MASASKSTTLYNARGNAYTLTASFKENSTSVSNNTSSITCTATLKSTNAYWSSSANSTLVIYWHDNKQNYDRKVASINLKTITQGGSKSASATITVTHKDDGTLSGYAKAVFTKGDTNNYTPKSGSVSTNNTALTTIARASQPTVTPSTFNIGDTITINTNRKSTAFTHTITLYFGNYSYQIGTGVTDTITFDTSIIADEMYQQIPNASVGVGNVTAVTYNGSTQIGSKNVLFYANVTNSNPTFNTAYLDTNSTTTAITGNNQQIIRNNSILRVNITNAKAKNYATLSTATCLINGATYNATISGTSATFNIGTLNIASNTTAVVTVTDSRGISTSQNLNITVLDWVLPTAIISLQRENNFYSETNINVNAEYSSLDNKNTISIKVRYKEVDESTYGSYTTLQDEVTTQLTLDNNFAWNVQVLLEDKIGSTTYNLVLDRGIPITFFDRLKRSVGINCFPADNGSLEVSDENILKRIAGYGQIANQVTGDWDTACGDASGIYMGNGLTHSPSGSTVSNWWWVIHIVHNDKYQRQIAYSFLNNSEIYTRIQNNGTWNTWTTIAGGGGGGTSDYTALVNKPKINGVELNGNKSASDLGISIPSKTSDLTNDSNFVDNTTTGDLNNLSTISKTNLVSALNEVNGNIPTNTSDLTNDSGFIDNSYHDSTKQDALVSGTNIKTINNQSLLGSGNIHISGGGGTAIDVQINSNSIISNDVANLSVEGNYNASTNKIATMSEVPTTSSIVDLIYPVGSIYISTNSTSPATLFGGTWKQIKGRYLLGAGGSAEEQNNNGVQTLRDSDIGNSNWFPLGETGGEYYHKLTNNELPKLTGQFWNAHWANANTYANGVFKEVSGGTDNYTGTSSNSREYSKIQMDIGNNEYHATLSPYLAVNIWERTA